MRLKTSTVSKNVLLGSVVFKFIAMIIGVFGNVIVIIHTIFLTREKTATSYLVGNLALADLLVCLTFYPIWIIEFIQTILNIDSDQELFCKLTRPGIWSLLFASVATLLAISVDKYFYIVKPLRYPEVVTRRRVFQTIFGIWFVTCCLFIVLYFQFTSNIKLRSFCDIPSYISISNNIMLFCLPLTIIFILNFQILRTAQKQRRRIVTESQQGRNNTFNGQLSSRTAAIRQFFQALKSTKTLLTVVIVLTCCCFFPNIVGLVFHLKVCNESCQQVQQIWYIIFQYELFGINSIVNAFIYGMRHVKYRKAYRNILIKMFRSHSTNV